MRSRAIAIALFLMLPADTGAAQPADLRPVPISLGEQGWCVSPPNFCRLNEPSQRFDFSSDGELAFAISITAQAVDGKLVYRVTGTAHNQAAEPRWIRLTGGQHLEFSVPATFANGTPLPTTLVISSLVVEPSQLPTGTGGAERFIGLRSEGPPTRIESEILGAGLLLRLDELGLGTLETRESALDDLIAHDELAIGLRPEYLLTVAAGAQVSFDETITYELRAAGNGRRR